MRRSGRGALLGGLSVVLTVGALLAGTTTAAAAPPPPPNPNDAALAQSHAAVTSRAAQVGQLTGQLAALDARTDDLQAQLEARQQEAEAALDDLGTAQAAAARAAREADEAQAATTSAGQAVDAARARLDAFAAATYQEGLDTGPFGLLTGAQSPEDLVGRAEFSDIVARSELAARDGLERARVDATNADSLARAARAQAQERQAAAAAAKRVSDAALGAADAAAQDNADQLSAVATQRASVQSQLDAAVSQDATLRAQRQRFLAWQQQVAAEQAAAAAAARQGALGRLGHAPAGVRGSAQTAIDRALAAVGTRYVWGGGSGRGPTTGIDGARGTGFDCSGLMLYAYNGAGVALPRVARNQYNAGQKVPISNLRPGDLVFYQLANGFIHHVAMFIGNGQMVEAPYTGAAVRVVPLRHDGLVPEATRPL